MNSQDLTEKVAREISCRCPVNNSEIESWLNSYLADELKGLSVQDKIANLNGLTETFRVSEPAAIKQSTGMNGDFPRLMSLLLGSNITNSDLQNDEVMAKFAGEMNKLFDSLNQLIAALRMNLYGHDDSLETIRKIIGKNIDVGVPKISLKK